MTPDNPLFRAAEATADCFRAGAGLPPMKAAPQAGQHSLTAPSQEGRGVSDVASAPPTPPIWTHDGDRVLKRNVQFCWCRSYETASFVADQLNAFDANLCERNQWQRLYRVSGERESSLLETLETVKKMAQVEATHGSKAWNAAFTTICQALDPQEDSGVDDDDNRPIDNHGMTKDQRLDDPRHTPYQRHK